MMSRYRRTGKQILLDDKHFADAADELAAMQILNALKDMEQRHRASAPLNLNECRFQRQGDEFSCACGLRWSVDDLNPPLCAHRATS